MGELTNIEICSYAFDCLFIVSGFLLIQIYPVVGGASGKQSAICIWRRYESDNSGFLFKLFIALC